MFKFTWLRVGAQIVNSSAVRKVICSLAIFASGISHALGGFAVMKIKHSDLSGRSDVVVARFSNRVDANADAARRNQMNNDLSVIYDIVEDNSSPQSPNHPQPAQPSNPSFVDKATTAGLAANDVLKKTAKVAPHAGIKVPSTGSVLGEYKKSIENSYQASSILGKQLESTVSKAPGRILGSEKDVSSDWLASPPSVRSKPGVDADEVARLRQQSKTSNSTNQPQKVPPKLRAEEIALPSKSRTNSESSGTSLPTRSVTKPRTFAVQSRWRTEGTDWPGSFGTSVLRTYATGERVHETSNLSLDQARRVIQLHQRDNSALRREFPNALHTYYQYRIVDDSGAVIE